MYNNRRAGGVLFKLQTNWGRIVGLFAFGGVLCVEYVEKDEGNLVGHIADGMTIYLGEHIQPGIQSRRMEEYSGM